MMLTCAICGNQTVEAHFPDDDNQRFNYTRLIIASCTNGCEVPQEGFVPTEVLEWADKLTDPTYDLKGESR